MSEQFPPDRRRGKFTEKLSMFMCIIAAIGAAAVLLDPKFVIQFSDGTTFSIGGDEGFSADLKGAVITAILISGWTAVKEFWLGASAAGNYQIESMSRIAESATPSPSIKPDQMNVQGDVIMEAQQAKPEEPK